MVGGQYSEVPVPERCSSDILGAGLMAWAHARSGVRAFGVRFRNNRPKVSLTTEVERRAKKIAAALAAVTAVLAEEEAAGTQHRPRQHGRSAGSAWSLAGRLALMSTRLPGGYRR